MIIKIKSRKRMTLEEREDYYFNKEVKKIVKEERKRLRREKNVLKEI